MVPATLFGTFLLWSCEFLLTLRESTTVLLGQMVRVLPNHWAVAFLRKSGGDSIQELELRGSRVSECAESFSA